MTDDIFSKPRTGDEVKQATGGVPIRLYSALCEEAKRVGVDQLLRNMFEQSYKYIILLQDPEKMNSGHWMALEFNPRRDEVYFFSSYGGKPDFEKNKWLRATDRRRSNQNVDIFNDGLKNLARRGWTIYYNDHPYQHEGDRTATCGIWAAAFLNSGMNPDQFYRYNLRNHMGAPEYFAKYFRKRD